MPLEEINRQEPLEWYVQRGDGNRDKTSAGRQKEALWLGRKAKSQGDAAAAASAPC